MEDNRGVYQCVASLVVAGGDQRQAAANGRLSVIRTFSFPFTVSTSAASLLSSSLPLSSDSTYYYSGADI